MAACVLSPSVASAADPIFALNFAVAPDVTSPAIDQEVALAEGIFGPLGVHLHVWHQRPLDARFASIESLPERDALSALVTPGEINVFVVRSLRDSDVADMYRRGVTWDSRTTPSRRYIILAADAARSSLAHELGHFFGIFAHSGVKNNLMSYDRDDDLVFLDASQKAIVQSKAQTDRTSGALVVFGYFLGK